MLRVDNISYEYSGTGSKVLDQANLELKQGEIVLLSGPTGSGKSTMALLAAGILQRHGQGLCHGSITLGGRDVTSIIPRDLARELGILFQNVDLQLFHDRVTEDIAFGPENLGFSPESVSICLERELSRFDLCSYRDREISTLSGGYRQRVAMAGMIAMGQGYLILDEPLAFLDRSAGQSLVNLLGQIKQRIGVLLIEHRTDLVKAVADRVLHLSNGEVLPGSPPASANNFFCYGPGGPEVMRAQEASYRFPKYEVSVLKGCTLTLRQGISHVLLGDNGCGKTTLLKVLAGLINPLMGSVELVASKSKGKGPFQGVGLVLQNPDHQLFMPTVAEEVQTFARQKSLAGQLLEELHLDPFAARHPQSLSRGQKRRLALAAILAQRPRVLLLDEPTVGQDPESLKLMLIALHRFVSEGGCLLSATHDYHAGRALGQVVWHMGDGRILEQGGSELVKRYFSEF